MPPTTNAPTLGPTKQSAEMGYLQVADGQGGDPLCYDRVDINRYRLSPCDGSKSQLFQGLNPNPTEDGRPTAFELKPRDKYGVDRLEAKCLNMHHHPRNYEEIINTSCDLARTYYTAKWHVVMDSERDFTENDNANLNTFLMSGKTGAGDGSDLTTLSDITDEAALRVAKNTWSAVQLSQPESLYTLLQPRRNPRCSKYSRCGICQGHCNADSDCVGSLKCFERTWTNPQETPPGCVGGGEPRKFYFSLITTVVLIVNCEYFSHLICYLSYRN